MTIKVAHDIPLADLGMLSLYANFSMQKEVTEALSELTSQAELHGMCISMFNEIATRLVKLDSDPDLVLVLNFIGTALECDLNIMKMMELSNKRTEEFRSEIVKRANDA